MMRLVLAMYVVSGGVLWLAGSVRSQEPQNAGTQASSPQPPGEESPADLPTTVFPHSETSRFWVSGQMNFIEQWHPSFHSPYQGPLSLTPEGEHALSRVFTLFTGVELTSRAEVLFQLESAGGKGIGNGFGLAGFTNLDVVHNPSLGSKPYVGRTMLHFIIPLSHDRTPTERNPLSVFRNLPARRLEIRLGKFQLVDFFDLDANMGDYRVAIRQFESGETAVPDITNHPFRTTTKYGFGANLEQSLNSWLTAFWRFGWNEGRRESFAYTEVNQAVTFGIGANGKKWRRGLDRAGAAFSSNAISGDHRLYLALGGKGFLLGDGHLNYGRENIFEMFYTIHVWRSVYGAFDLQHINNPGYNRDRGPVVVPAVRLHLDL
jgi:TM2 domain-containing membrane protein YozV